MNDDYSFRAPAVDSAEYNVSNTRKQVVKVNRRLNIRGALDQALQSTQFEGLKILTRDTILRAHRSLE